MKGAVHRRGAAQDFPALGTPEAAKGKAGGKDLLSLSELLGLWKVPEVRVSGLAHKAQAVLLEGFGQAFESPGTPVRCLPDLRGGDWRVGPVRPARGQRCRTEGSRTRPQPVDLPPSFPFSPVLLGLVCGVHVRPESREDSNPVKGHSLCEWRPVFREGHR